MKLSLATHAMSYQTCAEFYHFLDNEVQSEGSTFRKMAITAIPPIQQELNYNMTRKRIHFYVNIDWLKRTDTDSSQLSDNTFKHLNLPCHVPREDVGTF